jgi:hypothetical protein
MSDSTRSSIERGNSGKPKVFKGVQVSNNQLALRADLAGLTARFYHSTRGVVRFQPNANGSTTVHIHMSYNQPAGAIGHALATVLGADPKKKMDDDLMRMKTMIEEKTVAYDVAENPLAI